MHRINDRTCLPTTFTYKPAPSASALPCHYSLLLHLTLPNSHTRNKKRPKKTLEHFNPLCFLQLTFLPITMNTAFGALHLSSSCSSCGAYTALAWVSIEVKHADNDNEAFLLTFDFSHLKPHSQVPWPEACRLVHSALSRRVCAPVDVLVFIFA